MNSARLYCKEFCFILQQIKVIAEERKAKGRLFMTFHNDIRHFLELDGATLFSRFTGMHMRQPIVLTGFL